jgi:formylglycine-generating enzyme required for sulfatase activity
LRSVHPAARLAGWPARFRRRARRGYQARRGRTEKLGDASTAVASCQNCFQVRDLPVARGCRQNRQSSAHDRRRLTDQVIIKKIGSRASGGNVNEWTQDCWHEDYVGAPSDGLPWTSGDCGFRVSRGGSWYSFPALLRAARRNRDFTDLRSILAGFRVARTLSSSPSTR